jgi:hypothetical protein
MGPSIIIGYKQMITATEAKELQQTQLHKQQEHVDLAVNEHLNTIGRIIRNNILQGYITYEFPTTIADTFGKLTRTSLIAELRSLGYTVTEPPFNRTYDRREPNTYNITIHWSTNG